LPVSGAREERTRTKPGETVRDGESKGGEKITLVNIDGGLNGQKGERRKERTRHTAARVHYPHASSTEEAHRKKKTPRNRERGAGKGEVN